MARKQMQFVSTQVQSWKKVTHDFEHTCSSGRNVLSHANGRTSMAHYISALAMELPPEIVREIFNPYGNLQA